MPGQYVNRQTVRQSLGAEFTESYLFEIERVSTENNLTRLHSPALIGHNSFKTSQILYGGEARLVTEHNSETGYIDVSTIPNPPASGVMELWQRPHTIRSLNTVIDTAIDQIIDLGYVVEDSHEQWLIPGFSRQFRVPSHIKSFRDISAPGKFNGTQSGDLTLGDVLLGSGVTRTDEDLTSEIRLSIQEVDDDGLIVNFPLPYNATFRSYDTLLVGLRSNQDITVRVNGGITDDIVSLRAGVPRVVPLSYEVGVQGIIQLNIHNANGGPLSGLLDVFQTYYYVQSRSLTDFRLLARSEWQVDRPNRSIEISGPLSSPMRGPVLFRLRAFRLPRPVAEDGDIIECPLPHLVAVLKAKLLQDSQSSQAQDTRGVAQRVGIATSKEIGSLRSLPRPSSSHFVGNATREIEVDVMSRSVSLTLSVGYIEDRLAPHTVLSSGVFASLPAVLSVPLPTEEEYISIEWSGAAITTIVIDGLDQTRAFTLEGNRAVSNDKVILQGLDKHIVVRIE